MICIENNEYVDTDRSTDLLHIKVVVCLCLIRSFIICSCVLAISDLVTVLILE